MCRQQNHFACLPSTGITMKKRGNMVRKRKEERERQTEQRGTKKKRFGREVGRLFLAIYSLQHITVSHE